MEKFQPGDLITYRLHGDDFGLAQVLVVEDLSLHNYYHLALLDAVLKGEEGDVDSYGVAYSRTHTLDGAEQAPVVVDHIAVTFESLAESDPVKVGEREVRESDLVGYQVWMMHTREDLVRRGLIRPELPEDDGEEEEFDEMTEIDEIAGETGEDDLKLKIAEDDLFEDDAASGDREDEEETGAVDDAADDSEGEQQIAVELRPWHSGVYSGPLQGVLFNLHTEFARPEVKDTALGSYICSFFDERNMDAIGEMVDRFVEGDYSAGHELMAFGDLAADALAAHLQEGMEQQLAEDIVNILCETGSMRGYEHIAAFFAEHEPNPDDPLGLPAARGYAYAVMLTGGTPVPLHPYLDSLDDIENTYPELAHDVSAARDAMTSAPADNSGATPTREASADPFAGLA